jgi:hypothetical protein
LGNDGEIASPLPSYTDCTQRTDGAILGRKHRD